MPAYTRFFNELRKDTIILVGVLGMCVVSVCVIWYWYEKKIDTVDKKIDKMGYEIEQ